MRHAHLILIFVILLLTFVQAKITFLQKFQESTYSLDGIEGLVWNTTKLNFNNDKRYVLLPLHIAIGDHNPCDGGSLARAGTIDSMLEYYGENKTTNWIGYSERQQIFNQCGEVPYSLMYSEYIAETIQELGGKAIIYGNPGKSYFVKLLPPSNVDVEERKVNGVEITIASMVIDNTSKENQELLQKLSSGEVCFYVISMGPAEENPFDNMFVRDVWGPWRYFFLGISVYSMCLWVICIRTILVVCLVYNEGSKSKGSKSKLTVRLLILVPELLNGVIRAIANIDPAGLYYGSFNYFVGFTFGTGHQPISCITDIGLAIFCMDIYKLFKAAGKLQGYQGFFVRHKYALHWIVTLCTSYIVLVRYIYYLHLIGKLNNSYYGTISQTIVTLVVSIILAYYVFLMGREIKSVMKSTGRTRDSEKSKSKNLKVTSLQRVWFLMILALLGRVTLLIGAALYIIRFDVSGGPLGWCIVWILNIGGSLFTSTIQIISTIELQEEDASVVISRATAVRKLTSLVALTKRDYTDRSSSTTPAYSSKDLSIDQNNV